MPAASVGRGCAAGLSEVLRKLRVSEAVLGSWSNYSTLLIPHKAYTNDVEVFRHCIILQFISPII